MKKLSIITVCLNNRIGLEKTIRSVVTQSFQDYEFIIVDGGSTDGSVEMIKGYEDRIHKWISEKDEGIYNAMNKGILIAQGDYCLFLNSGDYLSDTDIIDNIFNQSPEVDIIYGDLIRQKGPKNYRFTTYPDKLTLYHFVNDVPSLHHQASFIKRKLFEQFGFYREDLKIVADWEFFFRAIILNNCSTYHVQEKITVFDSFGISSGGRNTEKDIKLKVLKENIPDRILSDYDNIISEKKGILQSLKTTVLKFPFLYKYLRMIYLPFRRLTSYLNYMKLLKN